MNEIPLLEKNEEKMNKFSKETSLRTVGAAVGLPNEKDPPLPVRAAGGFSFGKPAAAPAGVAGLEPSGEADCWTFPPPMLAGAAAGLPNENDPPVPVGAAVGLPNEKPPPARAHTTFSPLLLFGSPLVALNS